MKKAIWWALYLICMSMIVSGMFKARKAALSGYGTPEAQSQWDEFRQKAEQDADEEGPVIRAKRESIEPPALVLMRDYFAACMGLALLLSSVLFVTLAVMFEGAIARAPKTLN